MDLPPPDREDGRERERVLLVLARVGALGAELLELEVVDLGRDHEADEGRELLLGRGRPAPADGPRAVPVEADAAFSDGREGEEPGARRGRGEA